MPSVPGPSSNGSLSHASRRIADAAIEKNAPRRTASGASSGKARSYSKRTARLAFGRATWRAYVAATPGLSRDTAEQVGKSLG